MNIPTQAKTGLEWATGRAMSMVAIESDEMTLPAVVNIATQTRNRARVGHRLHVVVGRKVWLITEADRSSTTVLLPEEY